MKTIAEAEPRIPLDPASPPLHIAAQGSYYLLGDVDCRGLDESCIAISADNVTLDLNGYAVIGGSDGIRAADRVGVTVRNGVVRRASYHGLSFSRSVDAHIEALRIADNGDTGAYLGSRSRVSNCAFVDNVKYGLYATEDSIVLHSTAVANGNLGFRVGDQAIASHCVAADNGDHGFSCAGDGCTIENSSARKNAGSGIDATHRCLIRHNNIYGHAPGADLGAGIAVSGSFNRIDGNHVIGNDDGILVTGTKNVIIRNTVGGNKDDFNIVAGNDVGPIGSASSATSPWANIRH